MNVLLLDSEAARDGARHALEESGAAVAHAADAAAALALLDAPRPDVVVVERGLAAEFIQSLRARGNQVPLVAFASGPVEEWAVDCMRLGADDCVEGVENLGSAVQRARGLGGAEPRVRELEGMLRRKDLELALATRRLGEFRRMAVNAQKTGNVVALVRGVCHELNNPLTGILGYAQLLQEVWEGEGLDDLKEIESCAQRCRDIIGKLARFCRSEKATLSPLKVNEVLEETLQFVEYYANRHRARLLPTLGADVPETLGYPSDLRHALVAVLVNGIQAMQAKRGGTLTVKTGVRDACIYIDVTDGGEGIAPENLERVFHPFFTTRDPSEYSGMGLAVAYEVMKAHEGTILVDSTPGTGTTMSLVMPIHRPALSPEGAVAATPAP